MGESRKVVICRLQTEEAKKLKEKMVFNRTKNCQPLIQSTQALTTREQCCVGLSSEAISPSHRNSGCTNLWEVWVDRGTL